MLGKVMAMFSGGVDKVIDSVGDAIDKNITTDEERLAKRNEMESLKLKLKSDLESISVGLEKEYSRRHELDMKSDSRLSKNIRPLALIYLLGVVTILALTDGNIQYGDYQFLVKDEYVNLFRDLLLMIFGFYVGGRSLEKITKMFKG